MPDLVPIGRFSHITQLSIKALRLYAEEGLLYPTHIDPESGYRYYSLSQAEQAARIRLLRDLEMPLNEIREVVSTRNTETIQVLLRRHQERIAQRVARYEHILGQLQTLSGSKADPTFSSIKVNVVAPQPILSMRLLTDPSTFEEVIPATVSKLYSYMARRDLDQSHLIPLVIHHDYNEDLADVEVGVITERLISASDPMSSRILEGGLTVSMMHAGPYEDLGVIYPMLANWLLSHGYEVNGPPRELFLTSYTNDCIPGEHQTEIIWPIR